MDNEICKSTEQEFFTPKRKCELPQEVTVYTNTKGVPLESLGDLAFLSGPSVPQGWVLYDNLTFGPLPDIGGGGITSISQASDVNIFNLQVGHALIWNGTHWTNQPVGGGGPTPDFPWDEVDEHIDEKVDEKVQDIIDAINQGELDVNTLKATMNSIIQDHPRILEMISTYGIPTSLSNPYNAAYTALNLYVQPYIDGEKNVVEDPVTFEARFIDYYNAKAAIEKEVNQRIHQNELQAIQTREVLDKVIDFSQTQLLNGVVVTGTLAVGTPSFNNAGVTGVTDQGGASVRFWAGDTFENRYSAPFRVLHDGRIWAGTAESGLDIGITRDGLTFRGAMYQTGPGEPLQYINTSRGPYNPGFTYYPGELVLHENFLWEYRDPVPGNGGVPSESNTNWRIYLTSGSGVFRQHIYRRAPEQPARPTGGSYEDPYPLQAGWFDSPPSGSDTLWETTRIFTQTGEAPQEAQWKNPYAGSDNYNEIWMWSTLDTFDQDLVGTPDSMPTVWSDNDEDAIWKAERMVINGVETGDWKVFRVRGEAGLPGEDGEPGADGANGNFYEERYAVNGSWETYDPIPAPSPGARNPAGWSTTIPVISPLQYLWKVRALISGEDDSLLTTWSTPVRETGAPGADGLDGDGAIVFKSIVFRRTTQNIASISFRPTGGSHTSPIPTSSPTWYDQPPNGTAPLWASSRTFSDDPDKQDINWSVPSVWANTPEIEYAYSPDPPSPGGGPSGSLPSGTWTSTANASTAWTAIRHRPGGVVTDPWGPWQVMKVRGEEGLPGKNAPIVIPRDLYSPDATYVGSPTQINQVIWGGNAYYTRVDPNGNPAGLTFSGIPPSNTNYWNQAGFQAESIYTKLITAATGYIDEFGTKSLRVGKNLTSPNRFVGTTIGNIPSNPYTDPTANNNIFREFGKRDYYDPSGRIMSYDGYVENFQYKDGTGADKTVTGKVQITFKDEEGSPVFSVFDGTVFGAGIIYPSTSTATWNKIDYWRTLGGGLTSGATDNQLKAQLFYGTGSPTYTINPSYWCGSVDQDMVSIGMISSAGGSSIYERVEAGQPLKYRTAPNDSSGGWVPNGWYFLSGLSGGVVYADAGLEAEIRLNVTLRYIQNGVVTATRNLANIPVFISVGGSGFTTCPVGTLPIFLPLIAGN